MDKKLHIILRTCNRKEHHPQLQRIIFKHFPGTSRRDMILRCLNSLLSCTITADWSVRLTIVDDSDKDFVEAMTAVHRKHGMEPEYVFVEEQDLPGPFRLPTNKSMHICYNLARESESDVILFVEDDYLFYPDALEEMCITWEQLSTKLGEPISIHPEDLPLGYSPKDMLPGQIYTGDTRYWKRGVSTSFALWIPTESFKKHYETFDRYANWDGETIHEGNTVNLLYWKEMKLVTPIRTLCYHLGYISPPTPFSEGEWQKLYKENEVIL